MQHVWGWAEHIGKSFNSFTKVMKECHFYKQQRFNKTHAGFLTTCSSRLRSVLEANSANSSSGALVTTFTRAWEYSSQRHSRTASTRTSRTARPRTARNRTAISRQKKKKIHFQQKCWNQNCCYEHQDFQEYY